MAAITFAAYMVGSGRALGYDAAVTMDLFVSGPPSWAVTRQHVWNNHPLFSLMESMVFDVFGGGEVVMRVLPVAFAALAVGLLAWRVAAKWGQVAGCSAALLLATHPMFASLSRDVRGYSLALLAIVVMGIAVLERDDPVLFAIAGIVGLGTHLYVAPMLACLVAWLLARSAFDHRWRSSVLVIGIGTCLLYAPTADQLGGYYVRRFRPTWPVDAGWSLFGGTVVGVAAIVVIAVIGSRGMLVDRRIVVGVGGVLAAAVLVPWLVAPPDLYPRFVYWALPGLAVCAGWAVRRARLAVLVVAVACAAGAVSSSHGWTTDELPNRVLASRAGPRPCVTTWPAEALVWYLDDYAVGTACDVGAILSPGSTPEAARMVDDAWPVICWQVDSAAVRAVDAAHCPDEANISS